jgi:hypothetical protein
MLIFDEVPENRDGFPVEGYHKRDVSASAPGSLLMQVYLDESGDTGWQLSLPYRAGGSSRFLCLAFLFAPRPLSRLARQIIVDLYVKYGWVKEKKAATASDRQKLEFAQVAGAMLAANKQMAVGLHCSGKSKRPSTHTPRREQALQLHVPARHLRPLGGHF